MEKFKNTIDLLCKGLLAACSILLLFLLFLSTSDVICRYLLNKAIIGALEMVEILIPAIVLLGLAYTQKTKSHIAVDFFTSRLADRPRAIVELIMTVLSIVLFLIIGWQGIMMMISYYEINSLITNIHIPMYIPRSLVPLGALAMCLVLVADLIDLVQDIKGRN